MKFDNIDPGEQIRQIAEIIREREGKELPTYFTISIEAGGKMTAVCEKEEGAENFKTQVMNLGLKHNLSAMKVDLFAGQSRNAKRMNEYYIPFKKKEFKTSSLRGIEREPELTPTEEVISLRGYMDEKLNMAVRVMQLENDKKNLSDKIDALTEKYEPEIQRLKAEIAEYERELEKMIKDKDNSLANVSLASVGVKLIEGSLRSPKIMQALRGVMGEASFNEFQQRLAGIDNEQFQQNPQPQKETARIIAEPESKEPRQIALNFIRSVGEKLNDQHLRMLYDIAEMSAQKPTILEELRLLAENIFKTKVIRIEPDTKKD